MADKYEHKENKEAVNDLVYNWIHLHHLYAKTETDLITSDVTRAFLNKGGLQVVRRASLLTNALKSMGMIKSAEMLRDVVGMYAAATLGLGNYATLIAQSAYSFKQFLRPEDYEEDLISSLTKKLGGLKKSGGGVRP